MKRIIGFLALAALPLAASCGGKATADGAEATEAPAITLGASDVGVAETATLRAGVALSGALEPKVKVDVAAPFAEQLVAMLVNEGDAVRQGQPLARFRDDVLRAAEASAQAAASQARGGVTLAMAESTRAETLFAEGAVARRDRDNALLALEQARAALALTQSQLALAAERLDNATLKAPTSGVVSRRHAQSGDRVDVGKPVVSIVDNRVLQLEASVEARWLAELGIGRPVSLVVTGMAGDTVRGRIARINPVADPATRQVRLYVEIPNGNGRLVGGLYVSGYALTREVRDAVAVPKAAVRTEGTAREQVVYVAAAGRLARRVVEVGVEDAERGVVQVVRGVSAGEAVVVGPVEGLGDGMRVEVAGEQRRP